MHINFLLSKFFFWGCGFIRKIFIITVNALLAMPQLSWKLASYVSCNTIFDKSIVLQNLSDLGIVYLIGVMETAVVV